MIRAFVLIQTKPGELGAVAEHVGAIEGVSSSEAVTGPYDVIAQVEAESIDALGELVVSRIQAVQGITRTITCPIVHV